MDPAIAHSNYKGMKFCQGLVTETQIFTQKFTPKNLCLVGFKNWTLLQHFSWCLGEIIWFLRVM